MFEPTLPATPAEWLPLIAPLVTLLIGIGFFFSPAPIMRHLGLVGRDNHPEAIGEGRSHFAGFLIGLPVVALLFGQPVLFQTLGVAWAIAATGKLIHIAFDDGRGLSVMIRFALAVVLAVLIFYQAGQPYAEFTPPASLPETLVAGAAAITVLFGSVAFLMPRAFLSFVRLQAMPGRESASGEIRGALAGFHIAGGLAALMFGGVFVELGLGAAWLATAFGRMISMLSDRANNLLNWLLLLVELALGAIPLAVVLGLIT
jgi:hypothetical protein